MSPSSMSVKSHKCLNSQKTFDQRHVSVSALVGDCERNFEPPDNRTPEDIFMHQWACAVIASVRARVQSWCVERGRPDWYRVFCETYFPAPGCSSVTQQALAERLNLSRDQVRYGLREVHGRFIELLRAEVSDQLGGEEDLDTEIRELQQLLSRN